MKTNASTYPSNPFKFRAISPRFPADSANLPFCAAPPPSSASCFQSKSLLPPPDVPAAGLLTRIAEQPPPPRSGPQTQKTPIPFDRCFHVYALMFICRRFRGPSGRRNRTRQAGDSRAIAAQPPKKSGATSWRQPSDCGSAAEEIGRDKLATAKWKRHCRRTQPRPRNLMSSLSKNATALKPAVSSVPSCLPSFLAWGSTVTV